MRNVTTLLIFCKDTVALTVALTGLDELDRLIRPVKNPLREFSDRDYFTANGRGFRGGE